MSPIGGTWPPRSLPSSSTSSAASCAWSPSSSIATRNMKRFLLIALTLLAPTSAWAGGEALLGRGARALGRAGAFVAGADDGQAFFYNPAGLVDVEGVSLLIDGGFVFQRID